MRQCATDRATHFAYRTGMHFMKTLIQIGKTVRESPFGLESKRDFMQFILCLTLEHCLSSVSTIQQWFREARRFTHAPEQAPEPEEISDSRDCEDLNAGDSDLEEHVQEAQSDNSLDGLGTLYAHFYRVNPQTVSLLNY